MCDYLKICADEIWRLGLPTGFYHCYITYCTKNPKTGLAIKGTIQGTPEYKNGDGPGGTWGNLLSSGGPYAQPGGDACENMSLGNYLCKYALILDLEGASGAYNNALPYKFFPPAQGDYNSNSYVSGILHQVGISAGPPLGLLACPGWNEPITSASMGNYTPKYQHDSAICGDTMKIDYSVKMLVAVTATATAQTSAIQNPVKPPLYIAVENGNLEQVKGLVEHGEKANLTGGPQNYSLLEVACLNGSLQIVKFLVANGADMNHKSQGDTNALTFAAGTGHLDIVDFLLNQGAKVDAKTSEGWTALDAAALADGDRIDIFDRLLKAGADIDTKDKFGMTVLHKAVGCGNREIIKRIVQLRPNMLDIKAASGETPRALAARGRNVEIQKLLTPVRSQ